MKIYATDVDEDALDQARQATYAAKAVEAVPAALLERYFERVDERYTFRKDLRRTVIFGRNDLVQDAPISRIDLLRLPQHAHVLQRGDAGAHPRAASTSRCNDGGFLFLGKSEMLITHARPLHAGRPQAARLHARSRAAALREPARLIAGAAPTHGARRRSRRRVARRRARTRRRRRRSSIDADGALVARQPARARALFGLGRRRHRPAAPGPRALLPAGRAALAASTSALARAPHASTLGRARRRRGDGEVARASRCSVTPLRRGDELLGASVTFPDVTRQRQLAATSSSAPSASSSTAYEELQSTVEELETTNEELQSTNEELETTNEELQSTNEELETMNEELQSTNEELETINDELRAAHARAQRASTRSSRRS